MSQSARNLYGYRIAAADGLAEVVLDFYFNDQDWSVPNIVCSQHPTRFSKAILLPPAKVLKADPRENLLHVSLTRAECESLPSATSMLPVCRQYQRKICGSPVHTANLDPHLRCTTAVAGYEIHDPEQHQGIVHDFLIDPKTWTIAFLVGRRFGARETEFLVATSAVRQISFASRRVAIDKSSNWDLVFEEKNGYHGRLNPEPAY